MDQQYQGTDIEVLEEILVSLKITKEYALDKNRTTELVATEQAVMLRSMILDLEWFDRDQMKFEDWWRGIHLFLKSNRVTATDDKITAVLAQLRGGIIGIYTKEDRLNERKR